MVRFSVFHLYGGVQCFIPLRQHSNVTLKNEFIVEDPSCDWGFLTMAVVASDREKTKVGSSLL